MGYEVKESVLCVDFIFYRRQSSGEDWKSCQFFTLQHLVSYCTQVFIFWLVVFLLRDWSFFFFVIWCALSNRRFLISFKIRFFCIDKSRKLISQLLIFTITRNIWNLHQCDKISYFFAYQLSMVFLQLRYNLSYSPILVPPAGTW